MATGSTGTSLQERALTVTSPPWNLQSKGDRNSSNMYDHYKNMLKHYVALHYQWAS